MSTHDDSKPNPQASEESNPKLPGIDYSRETDVPKIHESILREKKEPEEGNEPVPFWVMLLIMLILVGASVYWGRYSGSFDAMAYDEKVGVVSGSVGVGAGGVGSEVALDPTVELVKLGKRQFTNNCASCHQPTGMGVAGQYPPLSKSEWVLGSERRLISILLHGLEGPINVEGVVYNGAMPNWGKSMNDKQIAAVLTYIRQEWGNSAGPISPDQVKAVRKEEESRSKVWSEAELNALPKDPVPGALPPATAPADKKS
jgi:mono/diheme cytochrome c family protein